MGNKTKKRQANRILTGWGILLLAIGIISLITQSLPWLLFWLSSISSSPTESDAFLFFTSFTMFIMVITDILLIASGKTIINGKKNFKLFIFTLSLNVTQSVILIVFPLFAYPVFILVQCASFGFGSSNPAFCNFIPEWLAYFPKLSVIIVTTIGLILSIIKKPAIVSNKSTTRKIPNKNRASNDGCDDPYF